ncbi:MAG: DUF4845 domain-containing protein [Gallionellaceae bacterium]
MNKAMPAKQRGLSFSGFIFGAVILVLAITTGMKLIPAYMEDAKIGNLFTVIANDPEMQKASLRDIRMSFTKRASIDGVNAINAEDIEITSNGGRLVLSASYAVKIPLAGNISLYMDFSPASAK